MAKARGFTACFGNTGPINRYYPTNNIEIQGKIETNNSSLIKTISTTEVFYDIPTYFMAYGYAGYLGKISLDFSTVTYFMSETLTISEIEVYQVSF